MCVDVIGVMGLFCLFISKRGETGKGKVSARI